MNTKQPEALRLADELEKCWADPGLQIRSAAELRRLHAEFETLRAGYDAARLEIESLREREQLARDVNSRRVTELEERLGRWGGFR